MVTLPGRPPEEADHFDPRLGWAPNGRSLERQVDALDRAKALIAEAHAIVDSAPPVMPERRLTREEDARRKAAQSAQYEPEPEYVPTVYRGERVAFRQGQGIKTQTEGRPDRHSRAY